LSLGDLEADLVYISDVHLKDPADERSRLLLDSIRRLRKDRLQALVLGGDIFDFCFGASDYFQEKFSEYRELLEGFAASGCQVVFIQGNHEFSLNDLAWKGVEFVTTHDTVITLKCGTKFGFAHGDRFLADWSYRAYLKLTRSSPWKWGAKLVPAGRLDAFALKCSGYSRDRGEYRDLDIPRVIAAAKAWAAGLNVDHGIFGHFHFPFFIERGDTKNGRLVSVESWNRPNMLLYHRGRFLRTFPTKPGEEVLFMAAMNEEGPSVPHITGKAP
jgi:UDP-2,3-diacylglucosamine hydrolase